MSLEKLRANADRLAEAHNRCLQAAIDAKAAYNRAERALRVNRDPEAIKEAYKERDRLFRQWSEKSDEADSAELDRCDAIYLQNMAEQHGPQAAMLYKLSGGNMKPDKSNG